MRFQHPLGLLAVALAVVFWPQLVLAQAEADPPAPAANAEQPADGNADEKADDEADGNADEKPDDPKPQKPTPEELFAQGRDALFKGQYDKAVELLGKAVEADKTKTGYRLHLARAYRYAGQQDEATKHLEEIVKTAPDHVEAGQALGEVYSEAEKWEDVVRVLEPLLKYRHDYPTYHMLAEAKYNLDDHEKAREYYEEAVKLNPQSASDHYQLGNIHLSGNRFALAAESYVATLKLGLNTPVLRYKLASAYFNLRNYFGRIAVRQVTAGKPGTISENWYLIEAVPGRKDTFRCAPHRSAVYQLAKALEDGLEETPSIRVLRATIYLNARRFRQAYDMFTEIGPTVPEEDKALFYYYYAQAAFGTMQYDRYLELLEEAIKLDPDSYKSTLVDAYLQVADQANQAGQLDKYIEYLAAAVAESPQTASLHLKLGYAYEEARQFDKAIAQWQMVLDLEADHPQRMKLLNLIQKYRSGVAISVPTNEPAKAPAENRTGADQ